MGKTQYGQIFTNFTTIDFRFKTDMKRPAKIGMQNSCEDDFKNNFEINYLSLILFSLIQPHKP